MNKAVPAFAPQATARLLEHPYPGNVRELKNIIERAVQTPEMKRQELYAEIILGADTASIIKIEDFPSYYQANSDTRVIAGLDCAHGGERDESTHEGRHPGNTRSILRQSFWATAHLAVQSGAWLS